MAKQERKYPQLTWSQEASLASCPPSSLKERIAEYEAFNKAQAVKRSKIATEFSITKNEKGNYVLTGLGNQRVSGFNRRTLEGLMANHEAIEAFLKSN